MGWIADHFFGRSVKKVAQTHREITKAAESTLANIERELHLLPRVCGEATKSGKPCLVVPAAGYTACSRHGGKNAAPKRQSA